jgi:DNA-binding beta-propeller fold protein YncE
VLTLKGNYGVDALSPDGHFLYLIQHLEGEHYKVRGYDLRTNTLNPQAVIDKAEPNEKMAGEPLARADTPDGNLVLTLYRRPSGVPFVHALFAGSLVAICVDLPKSARVSPEAPSTWGIALRGSSLYVANAASGYVAKIQIGGFRVGNSVFLGAQPATRAATHPLVVSRDGARLYLARPQGLVAIDTATLAASRPLAIRAYGSLGFAYRGSRLFAVGDGTMQAFDTESNAPDGDARRTGRLSLIG